MKVRWPFKVAGGFVLLILGLAAYDVTRQAVDPAYAQRVKAERAEHERQEKQQEEERAKAAAARDASRREAELRHDAWYTAKQFVQPRLKAPATAKLASFSESGVAIQKNGNYNVLSWVDSQNSFGAQIRTTFTVTMKLSVDKWLLVDLRTS